jgi:hypothetical protein
MTTAQVEAQAAVEKAQADYEAHQKGSTGGPKRLGEWIGQAVDESVFEGLQKGGDLYAKLAFARFVRTTLGQDQKCAHSHTQK